MATVNEQCNKQTCELYLNLALNMNDNLIDILIICKFCCTISGHFSTTNVMRQGGVFYPWLLSMIAVSWETTRRLWNLMGLASLNMTLKLM